MLRRSLAALVLAVHLPTSTTAQDPCEGNQLGVTIAVTGPYLGEALEIEVTSPASPGGLGLLALSAAVGPLDHPLLGPSCLDVFHASFQVFPLGFDAAGAVELSALMPSDPSLLGTPPVFLSAGAFLSGAVGLSKTVPIWFAQRGAWAPTGKLSAPRGFLRATALGEEPASDRIAVFLSGGGDQSLVEPGSKDETWLFQPFTRTFEPGPKLSVPRNFHTQTRLADGRVLIAGGCDANGVVHASAEIYDPATNTIAAVASMQAPRSGHAATLLEDGRVLVSGGLADFQNAKTAFAAAMDTAQDTLELYDPGGDTWTMLPELMQSPRAGHGQVLWHDGRVLIISGASGGGVAYVGGNDEAVFTSKVDWFDPATLSLAAAPEVQGSGQSNFGLATIGDGDLLLCGGMSVAFAGSGPSLDAQLFDGGSWKSVNAPYTFLAFTTAASLPGGWVLLAGGLGGAGDPYLSSLEGLQHTWLLSPEAIEPQGSIVHLVPNAAPIGKGPFDGPPKPRGAHAMVGLYDGTFLVIGGMNGSDTSPVGTWALDDAWIFAP